MNQVCESANTACCYVCRQSVQITRAAVRGVPSESPDLERSAAAPCVCQPDPLDSPDPSGSPDSLDSPDPSVLRRSSEWLDWKLVLALLSSCEQ